MGAGFAIFVKAADALRTANIAKACGIDAWVAGSVDAGETLLLIETLDIRFGADDLALR